MILRVPYVVPSYLREVRPETAGGCLKPRIHAPNLSCDVPMHMGVFTQSKRLAASLRRVQITRVLRAGAVIK